MPGRKRDSETARCHHIPLDGARLAKHDRPSTPAWQYRMAIPADQKTQRRLAAVLAADVVGFSALMGQDEEGTLARIKDLRREVLEPKVNDHQGRVVKTTGDGILVEFPSPVEAVRCATEIQECLAATGSRESPKALQLRIGINLGDIII